MSNALMAFDAGLALFLCVFHFFRRSLALFIKLHSFIAVTVPALA